MGPELVVDSLSVEFGTGEAAVRVVDNVSFRVAAGEIVALVGESGSGKSVTAMATMGLIDRVGGRVAAGSVRLGDTDISALSERALADIRGGRISMIFQEPSRALNPFMRVGEQIAETVRRHRPDFGKAGARARAIEMLKLVELPDPEERVDFYPHQLSGGQCQRVMIAMALACEPSFLIADEPTTALDVTVQSQVLSLLMRLRDEMGLGILLITHDLGVVAETCDRALVMYSGHIVESGPVGRMFDAPRHPYTSGLLASVPTAIRPGQRFRAIPGAVALPSEWPSGCRFQQRCEFARKGVCDAAVNLVSAGAERESRCARMDDITLTGVGHPSVGRPNVPDAGEETLVTGEPFLVVKGVRKRYGKTRGKRTATDAVAGVDLQVRPGETVAVVGESGAGKSTLGRLINRLENPDGGTVVFDGTDIRALSNRRLRSVRKDIQMIFQDPFNSLNPRATVGAAVAEAMQVHRIGTRETRALATAELFERVGLREEHMGRYPQEFSGGQLQRVAIARALATNPRLVICDEPVAALDMSVRAQILNILMDLQRERGLAYVFVTHDLSLVRAIAHRVVVMRRGQVVEEGTTDQIFASPREPYTRSLLAAIPQVSARSALHADSMPSSPLIGSTDA